jgi:hypothetical protein
MHLIETGRSWLAPEPRPATDTEPRLQRPVLLTILHRCPDEQAADKNGGQNDNEQNKNDRGGGVHARKSAHPIVRAPPATSSRRAPGGREDDDAGVIARHPVQPAAESFRLRRQH